MIARLPAPFGVSPAQGGAPQDAPAAARGHGQQRAAQRGERPHPRGVMALGQHERLLLVRIRDFEDRRRRWPPILERRDAAFGGGAGPGVERAHLPPGLERQRDRRAARRGACALAQRPRQAPLVAEQHEHRRLARGGRGSHLDVPAPRRRPLQPGAHTRVDAHVLDVLEQLRQQLGVVLDRRQPERPGLTLLRAQSEARGEHASEVRALGGEQDPVLAAAVAAELDVVAKGKAPGGRFRIRAAGTFVGPASPLGAKLGQRPARGLAEAHGAHVLGELLDELGSVIVERHQRASDRRQLARLGMLEQALHGLDRAIGGEAQPPVLVGAREVDHALVAAPLGTSAPDRAIELLAHVRFQLEPGEQLRERLGLVGAERHAPDPADGVPAAAWDRPQQLAQGIVVGEAQHGLVVGERGGERYVGHGARHDRRRGGCSGAFAARVDARASVQRARRSRWRA